MQIAILAGGLGTRSQSAIPKILSEINGKTLLEIQLDSIIKYFDDNQNLEVLYLLGEYSDLIVDKIEKLKKVYLNIKLNYFLENNRLGTAGALSQSYDSLKDDFLLCFGDLLFDFDFSRFYKYSKAKKSLICSVVHPNTHSYDSDQVEFELGSKRVTKFLNKNEHGDMLSMAVAGIHYFVKDVIPSKIDGKQDLSKDLLTDCTLRDDLKFRFYAYPTFEYIHDTGTPERLKSSSVDFSNGALNKRSRKSRKRALFLDKDNTLIQDQESNYKVDKDTAKAIADLNVKNVPVFVITNQPKIAKGSSIDFVRHEFGEIAKKLEEENAIIDNWYLCPHHPDRGFIEEDRSNKLDCQCRKPNNGLLLQADFENNLDLENSFFVGDSIDDYKAAKRSGMKFFHTTQFIKCSINEPHDCFSQTSEAIREVAKYL
jgi:HAD superfamily hydrolase (TIGR01662 family)